MSDTICGKCRLPINPNEPGVRHYGFFVAHEESRCIYLLQQQLAELDAALARCVEALKTADCPECHGVGFTIDEWTDTVAECCRRPTRSGDCCGNPVPAPELRQEQRQCQWCAYKADVLASLPASAQAAAKVLAAARETQEKYNELLYGVSIKHPNETRHETALRYIRQAEYPQNTVACEAIREEKEGK